MEGEAVEDGGGESEDDRKDRADVGLSGVPRNLHVTEHELEWVEREREEIGDGRRLVAQRLPAVVW